MPLAQEKKLTVLCRVEAGCLGPEGESLIVGFCESAQKAFDELDLFYIHWVVIPRDDKSIPELQYQVNGKDLSHQQAGKYLQLFEETIDEFESLLDDMLTHQIEDYLGR